MGLKSSSSSSCLQVNHIISIHQPVAQGMIATEILELLVGNVLNTDHPALLPGMELFVGTQQDVLIPQLVDRNTSLAPNNSVNSSHLKV